MPLLGTGWLSGYAVTTLIGLSRKLKLASTRASPVAAKKLLSVSTCSRRVGDIKKVMTDVSSKPPNVLIYCGSNDTDNRIFHNVKHTLLRVLNVHSYAIYRLHKQHVSTQPWMDNTALLVIRIHDSVSTSVQKEFIKYLKTGGKILGLCSSFISEVVKHPLEDRCQPFIGTVEVCHPGLNQRGLQNVLALVEPFYFEGDQTVVAQDAKTKKPVIIQVTEGHGSAVYTLVHLELMTDGEIAENQELDTPSLNHWTQSEDARMSILSQILQLLGLNCQPLNAPKLTPVYLLAKKEDEQKLLQSLRSRLKSDACKGKDLSLHFVTSGKPIPKTTETILPIITEVENFQPLSFDWKKYQDCLQTKLLGQVVFYADVITSTQTVFDGNYAFVQSIPDDVGVIVVTGQQVKGQGTLRM